MMSPSRETSRGHLPTIIDPIQLAERGAHLTGVIHLADMPQLMQTGENSGDVRVDLIFERDEAEQAFVVHGTLDARVSTICQRCLEGMTLFVQASPRLILSRTGEHRSNESDGADVMVVDKPLLLSELVESELLLAWPMMIMHEPGDCSARVHVKTEMNSGRHDTDENRKNRFAALERLKKTT
jgi:uncharacterized protein